MRWWFWPLIFTIFIWLLLIYPEFLEKHYFKETLFDPYLFDKGTVTKLLPITPTDML
jgi:hypothetical protein